jgi:carbonic anhydrase
LGDGSGDFVNNTAKVSAKRASTRLTAASTLIAGLAGAGKVKIIPAIHDLKTGVVTFSIEG